MNLPVHSFGDMSSYPVETPTSIKFFNKNRVRPQIEVLELHLYSLNLKRLCSEQLFAYSFIIDINFLFKLKILQNQAKSES